MNKKTLTINGLIFLLLLGCLELTAYVLVNHKRDSISGFNKQIRPQFNIFTTIDPLLGWTVGKRQAKAQNLHYHQGYIVYGSQNLKNKEAVRVAIFGGSTSDGSLDGSIWVKTFYQNLENEFGPTIVFNGAVGGYNSHQELLKIIRDMEFLRPHLVITYDGANEMQGATIENHPMVTKYEHYFYLRALEASKLGFPYTLAMVKILKGQHVSEEIDGQHHGPPNPASSYENWIKNLSLIQATAKYHGAQYRAFLQPVLGFGKYEKSTRESQIQNTNYLSKRNPTFYIPALKNIHKFDFITNLTDSLDGTKDVYRDDCHLETEGNQRIAQRISEVVIRDFSEALRDKRRASLNL